MRACLRTAYIFKRTSSLLSRLRKETDLPLHKCKDALLKFKDDYGEALNHLNEQKMAAGCAIMEKKANLEMPKSIFHLLELTEINSVSLVRYCAQTDIVFRTKNFADYLEETKDFFGDSTRFADRQIFDRDQILSLLETNQQYHKALLGTIASLGEKVEPVSSISLSSPNRLVHYLHRPVNRSLSTCGAVLEFRDLAPENDLLAQRLAMHVCGMQPLGFTGENGLLSQPFLYDLEQTVETVLSSSSLELLSFISVDLDRGIVFHEREKNNGNNEQ